MNSRLLHILSLLLLAIAAVPASAEPELGSHIDHAKGSVTYADMAAKDANSRVMDHFARCKAGQRPQMAVAILNLPYLSAEQQSAIRKFVGREGFDDCLGFDARRLSFSPPALLGGLAEGTILSASMRQQLRTLHPASEEMVSKAGLAPRNLAEDFAQCVAEKNPALVLSLLNSVIGGEVETELLKQLTPQLGPCLPRGQTVSLDKFSVRSMLAFGLYRLMPVLSDGALASK